MKPKLIVISGFSGAGKGKLTQLLATRHDCLKIIRSCTTRPRRDASDHYTYLSEAEFLAMRENGAFLECNHYLDHWYGTPRDETCHILREGRQAIAEIDYHGFFQLLESRFLPREAVCGIFVAAEADALYRRLNARGSEFLGGDGILEKGVENTIRNVGELARNGMRETDEEIIRMMIKNIC